MVNRLMDYNEAEEEMERLRKTLDYREDFIIDGMLKIVGVRHRDGSYLEFHSAAWKQIDEEFMAVFTEHQGDHLYHREDIFTIHEWKKERKVRVFTTD